jgi:hypothetical protein
MGQQTFQTEKAKEVFDDIIKSYTAEQKPKAPSLK